MLSIELALLSGSIEPDCTDNETREPAAKWPCMDYDDPFGCLEALPEAGPVGASQPTNIEEDIAAYLDQPPIPRSRVTGLVVSGRGGVKMKAASPG